jgi:hypothetical protein
MSLRPWPVTVHDPDRGTPVTVMGLLDDTLSRGALSPMPFGSSVQSLLRSARVAPMLLQE